MNIGEPKREIIVEPIEEPRYIPEPSAPPAKTVPEPVKEPVPA